MKASIRVKINSYLIAAAFAVLIVIYLLNISAITVMFINQGDHKAELQKKDVIIQALWVSCEMDKFLFVTNPTYQEARGKEK